MSWEKIGIKSLGIILLCYGLFNLIIFLYVFSSFDLSNKSLFRWLEYGYWILFPSAIVIGGLGIFLLKEWARKTVIVLLIIYLLRRLGQYIYLFYLTFHPPRNWVPPTTPFITANEIPHYFLYFAFLCLLILFLNHTVKRYFHT